MLTRGHRFGPEFIWLSQLTWLFHNNEIAVFCWLKLKRPVFSVLQYTDCILLEGQERGYVHVIEYYFILFKSTLNSTDWLTWLSLVQPLLRVGHSEKVACTLSFVGGPLSPLSYPFLFFHPWSNQCWGSGSGIRSWSAGSACFRASRIRIRIQILPFSHKCVEQTAIMQKMQK